MLGTTSGDTAHRKLAAVGGCISYSHRGRYYTLNELTDYDEHGLWSYGDIHFSAHGTLLKTGDHIIDRSASGYYVDEFIRLMDPHTVARGRKELQSGEVETDRIR